VKLRKASDLSVP